MAVAHSPSGPIPYVPDVTPLDTAHVNRDAGPRFQRCACSCTACPGTCLQWLDVSAPEALTFRVARIVGDEKHDVGGSMWHGDLCGPCAWERVLGRVRRWFR